MSQRQQIPTWACTLVTAVALLLAIRITAAVNADMAGLAVVRTYLFWALVCLPVAWLGDVLMRAIAEYRVVRLVRARVRSRR